MIVYEYLDIPQKNPLLHGPVGDVRPKVPQNDPGVHWVHSEIEVKFSFAPYVPLGHKDSVPNRVPFKQ